MKKIIELNQNGIGRLTEREPFLLPDTLELEFKTKNYDLSNAFISLKNGVEEGKFKLTFPFVVDKRFLIGGKLEMTLRLYANDVLVKTFAITPIKLVETTYGIHAFDFLSLLEDKYNKLFEKVNELIEKHNALDEHVADIKENI
jgi:hypothetical protein